MTERQRIYIIVTMRLEKGGMRMDNEKQKYSGVETTTLERVPWNSERAGWTWP